jgi:hypothetical protein
VTLVRLFTLIALVCCSTGALRAQSQGPEPPSGLFGGTAEGTSRSWLDLSAEVGEAFESALPPEFRSRIQEQTPQSGGYSTEIKGSASFQQNRRRLNLTAQAFSAVQYYSKLDRVLGLAHSATLQTRLSLSRRSTLDASQSVAYSPSYLYRLFPSMVDPQLDAGIDGAPEYRVDEARSISESTRVNVASGSERGLRLSAGGQRDRTNFYRGTGRQDLSTVSGRGSLAHGLGRTGTISGEYEYRTGRFGYGGEGVEQRVRLSGSYAPALSRTRRIETQFSLAPSVTRFDGSTTAAASPERRYRIEGDASGRYPFLRKWALIGSYRREIQYLAVLSAPVFADAGQLGISGLIGDRVDVAGSAGYATALSVFDKGGDQLQSRTGMVRVRIGLRRSLAVHVTYLHYYYDLGGQWALAPELPKAFHQNGVRVGLTLWARPVGR